MTEQEALVGNVADEAQVKKATKTVKENRRLEVQDMKDLLKTHFGKRVMWRLLKMCNAFQSIYAEPGHMAYLAGKQEIGHHWMNEIIEADPLALTDMMRAHHKGK